MAPYPPLPDIPGVKAEGELLQTLRNEVADLLARENPRFPGAQPVSFAARHLQELQQQDYFVCEKSDGIRCLMYLTSDEDREITYLIDRKNDYYYVSGLHFPLPESEQSFHTGTITDGELVNDREKSGAVQLKYLVFDCLALGRSGMMHRTLDKRLAYFRDTVFKPQHALYEKYPDEKQFIPFTVELKRMERAYGIEMIFRTILPSLQHAHDGLIFTCRTTPYKFGTDLHILKWKPANENSVDFLLTLEVPLCEPDSDDERSGIVAPYPDYAAIPKLDLSVLGDGNEYIPYGSLYATQSEWDNMKVLNKPLDECIAECYQDEMGRWRFIRIREDKYEPNHISTVESVMESIHDRVGEADLLAIGMKIREAWKAREAAEASKDRSSNHAQPQG